MKRMASLIGLVGFSVMAMGAKGGGCSAEYAPGDGSSAEWETGPIPTASDEIKPMTCEWLESDNCWKQLLASGAACADLVDEPGTFNDDRDGCTYANGARWDFAGALSTPAKGSTQYPITNWRITDADGDACMTGKILGIGKTAIDVDGEVAVFESPSLTTYHLTCPDGSTYGNDQPGTCEDFGVRYLLRETPGVLFTCSGSDETCTLDVWGASSGEETVTTCDF